jgi:hypothetical protein
MSATHSTQWFWTDWIGDEAVRRLTPAERGVWIDLLALAAAGNPTGYVCDAKGRPLTLDEIARVTNAGSPDEVAKLIAGIVEKGAASRDRTGRLLNRRMVRDAELRAKRSRAGRKGAAHTNLINQQLRSLSRHMPQQMPRQNSQPPLRPLPSEERILSSENPAARARDGTTVEKNLPAGSLATALPTGALARQPTTEQANENPLPPPCAATRADLEAAFARRRTAPDTQPPETKNGHG